MSVVPPRHWLFDDEDDIETVVDAQARVAFGREWGSLAEREWLTWRAERTYLDPDFEPLMRVAFHAGFHRLRRLYDKVLEASGEVRP